MRVCIFTSSRAVSLNKVANDIKTVLTNSDRLMTVTILDSPVLNVDVLNSCDACIITMPFDLAWCLPYFFIAYEFRAREKPVIFYTTTEGRVPRELVRNWILRDIRFVVNSDYVREKLDEVNAKVVDVIPHGIDLTKISSLKNWSDEIRESLGIGNKTLVGYVAQGHDRKCHDLFSEVVKIVKSRDPSVEFLIITDKNGKMYYNDTDAIVKDEFGMLSEEMYYGYLHALDLYAHGSCSEGFGLPVLEAMACGKYIVHPDYKPLTEITTPEISSRVPPYEILLVKIGGAGIIYELKRYRPEKFAGSLLEAISLIKSSNGNNLKRITAKALSRARNYDYYKLYSRFIPMLEGKQV